MDYKLIENEYYIRVDKGEDIISSIIKICKDEKIETAHFRGIGCCGKIDIQTYIPQKEEFISHVKEGIFELLSIDGNVSSDNGELFLHAHASFSYLDKNNEIKLIGGHLKEGVVEYTAEIILKPAKENISRMIDEKTGISVWKLH